MPGSFGLPMRTYGLPSMRIIAVIALIAPVQWCGQSVLSLSLNDQTEKYGSCATSGTAGGRMGARGTCAVVARAKVMTASAMNRIDRVGGFLMAAMVGTGRRRTMR